MAKEPAYLSKETYGLQKKGERQRPNVQAKESRYRGKGDIQAAKETYNYRPNVEGKESFEKSPQEETYFRGKRDLLQRQKRPTSEAKESSRRDLLQRQKPHNKQQKSPFFITWRTNKDSDITSIKESITSSKRVLKTITWRT